MCTSSQALVAKFYVLCHNAVYQRLLRLTRSRDDAAELTQDTFVALLMAVRSGRTINHPYAWLLKTAYKLWCDWCARRTRATTCVERYEHLSGAVQSALEGMIAVESAEQLRTAVQRLPANHQVVLVFTVLDDLSYAEAAGFLGVSSKMVGTWRARALARLREKPFPAPDRRTIYPPPTQKALPRMSALMPGMPPLQV